jgi:hypothetical protein
MPKKPIRGVNYCFTGDRCVDEKGNPTELSPLARSPYCPKCQAARRYADTISPAKRIERRFKLNLWIARNTLWFDDRGNFRKETLRR